MSSTPNATSAPSTDLIKPEQAAVACLVMRMSRAKAFLAIAEHGSARAAISKTSATHKAPKWVARGAEPEALIALCERLQLGLTTYFDSDFPPALRHIPDPPLVLYVRGDVACLRQPCVAVVGARRCSRAGAEMAAELAGALLKGGLTVISGLAHGIDASSHRGALAALAGDSQGTNTVAVMGAGLASVYPRSNRQLAEALVGAGGALVSEYSPTIPPAKHQFPERNRLISGLSSGVVIVEAGERSGSLITARFALEQGREVMAVPGAVAPGFSAGCHRLLRDGAALVEGAADVFEALGYAPTQGSEQNDEPTGVPASLGAVLAAVQCVVTTLDELVTATGLAPAELAAKLLELELAGFVHQVAEGYIRRPFSRSW